jgi:hypothetical protein
MSEKNHHFFASSVGEWQVDEDLFTLLLKMDKMRWDYTVYYVPVAITEPYKINMYAPMVEGVIYLGVKKFTRK